jgi:hypothetical protein
VNAHIIVVAGEFAELAPRIRLVPEHVMVEILSADWADQPFDEWVRAGHERYGPNFFNL